MFFIPLTAYRDITCSEQAIVIIPTHHSNSPRPRRASTNKMQEMCTCSNYTVLAASTSMAEFWFSTLGTHPINHYMSVCNSTCWFVKNASTHGLYWVSRFVGVIVESHSIGWLFGRWAEQVGIWVVVHELFQACICMHCLLSICISDWLVGIGAVDDSWRHWVRVMFEQYGRDQLSRGLK